MDEAQKLAGKLASKGPIAMRMAKKCINYGENVDLPSGLLFEQKTWAFLFSTEDQTEGMKAFVEKRKPVFQGK
jgi:enoyl-CoA hydratase